jgi:hypothetical protein
MAVFWVVAPCSLVEVYQRFRGPCCLHHQGDFTRLHGSTTQKTAIFNLLEVQIKISKFYKERLAVQNVERLQSKNTDVFLFQILFDMVCAFNEIPG